MREAPAGLDVRWQGAGATVALNPLIERERKGFFPSAGQRILLLYLLVAVPLTLGEMLGLLSDAAPVWTLVAISLLGPVWELVARWRRGNARLTFEIGPQELRLIHHMNGVHVVTEVIPLETLRRVDHDGDTLRFVLDDRTISEPMPALGEDERAWLVEMVLEARSATAEFWRDQLAHAAREAEVRQLTEGISPPR